MGTIVQDYGPIYGEAVNGTVQGRPNGSVYVPSSNTIAITLGEDYRYIRYNWNQTQLLFCQSDGTITLATQSPKLVAISQDLSSNMFGAVYTDAALTTAAASRDGVAGRFNEIWGALNYAIAGLQGGDTLYFRAQLMNNSTAVATSDTIELEFVET